MEHIFLPTSITFEDTDRPHVGRVVITPCHQGYGTTLANALRRVLLSSLPGAALESVKIKGVQHEFQAIEGVLEDVIQVILNLKQIAVRSHAEGPVTLSLVKKGKGDVTAGDFEKNPDIEIINKDLKIMTITSDSATVDMEVVIGRGRGYVPVAEKQTKNVDLGTIMIDSLYTPIRDVGYDIELTRVGDVTDYEKLTLTIETNGTITPKAAVSQTTRILLDHFNLIAQAAEGSDESVAVEMPTEEPTVETEEVAEEKPKKSKKKKSE